ncbi:MAG: hypothetical protein V4628_05205 [Pseudomonadota bacterium]
MTTACYAQIVNSEGQILETGYINDANGRFHPTEQDGQSLDREYTRADVPEGAYVDCIVDFKGGPATEVTRELAVTIAKRFGWPVHKKFLAKDSEPEMMLLLENR